MPSRWSPRGRKRRPPRRQQRRERLAQQARDLRQREHAVGRGVVDAREVVDDRVVQRADDVVLVDELVARVEAEDAGHGRAGSAARCGWCPEVRAEAVAEAQRRDGDLRRCGPRSPAPRRSASTMSDSIRVRGGCGRLHLLGEEARVVALAAVVVRGGLEDELRHRRVRPAAGREDVHRPEHVHLVRDARRAPSRSRRPGGCRSPCRSRRRGRSAAAARAGCRRARTRCAPAGTTGRRARRR